MVTTPMEVLAQVRKAKRVKKKKGCDYYFSIPPSAVVTLHKKKKPREDSANANAKQRDKATTRKEK